MKHQNAELTFNAPWVATAPKVFFFALFPAFFGYHALIATGVIPPVLPGGGWSVTNAAGILLLIPLALVSLNLRSRATAIHAAVVGLAAWAAVYAVVFALYGADHQRGAGPFLETAKLLIGWGCLYAIGYLIRPDERFARLLFYALAGMAAYTVIAGDPATLNSPIRGAATYQWFANAVVFTSIFCLAALPLRAQPAVLAVALATLFLLGSRSEFVGFVMVALAWLCVSLWQQRFTIAMSGAAFGLVAVALVYASNGLLPLVKLSPAPVAATEPTQSATKRHAETLDLPNSKSWRIRTEFQNKGWAAIRSSPVMGAYAGQMRDYNRQGTYIHNALSAWRQFGLAPFLLYVGLTVAAAGVAAWAVFVRRSTDPMWALTLYVGGFTLLLIIATKSVFWPLPALAWGLLAGQLDKGDADVRS